MCRLRVAGLGRGDRESLKGLLTMEPRVSSVLAFSPPAQLASFLTEAGIRLIALDPPPEEAVRDPAGARAGIQAGSLSGSLDPGCAAGRGGLKSLLREGARRVIEAWENDPRALLVLPGKPGESSGLLQALREQESLRPDFSLVIYPGEEIRGALLGFLEAQGSAEGFPRSLSLVDVFQLGRLRGEPPGDLLVTDLCGGWLFPGVQQALLAWYPPEQPLHLLQFAAGETPERVRTLPLRSLAAAQGLTGWMHLHLPPPRRYTLGEMMVMMDRLRAPGGCPWDRQQDHQTLKPYLIEEAYEVLAAIESGDAAELCEELGDLLLQVVFHSCLAREKGEFTLWEVIDGITRKIYRRHPHVFSGEQADTARQVSLNWQEIKQEEKRGKQKEAGRFAMPEEFPALMKAQKVQKRAADVGFDWPDIHGAFEKLQEEIEELKNASARGTRENVQEEMGDLFFALVNIARFLGVDAELVLHGTVEKFKRRFQYIEEQVKVRGGDYSGFSLEELDFWWEEAKDREKD